MRVARMRAGEAKDLATQLIELLETQTLMTNLWRDRALKKNIPIACPRALRREHFATKFILHKRRKSLIAPAGSRTRIVPFRKVRSLH